MDFIICIFGLALITFWVGIQIYDGEIKIWNFPMKFVEKSDGPVSFTIGAIVIVGIIVYLWYLLLFRF